MAQRFTQSDARANRRSLTDAVIEVEETLAVAATRVERVVAVRQKYKEATDGLTALMRDGWLNDDEAEMEEVFGVEKTPGAPNIYRTAMATSKAVDEYLSQMTSEAFRDQCDIERAKRPELQELLKQLAHMDRARRTRSVPPSSERSALSPSGTTGVWKQTRITDYFRIEL